MPLSFFLRVALQRLGSSGGSGGGAIVPYEFQAFDLFH